MNSTTLIIFGILMLFSHASLAQSSKGINFQAVIKRTDGTDPSISGTDVYVSWVTGIL